MSSLKGNVLLNLVFELKFLNVLLGCDAASLGGQFPTVVRTVNFLL